MEIINVHDYDEMSRKCAQFIAGKITSSERIVLGLPTGGTPLKMYHYLAQIINENNIDMSHVYTVNLDEYVGLDGSHEASYRHYMQTAFFDKVNIPDENTFIPNGKASDLEKEAADYDRLIEELGGIDLMIMGIGRNGHIAFNEPGTPFDQGTHVIQLTQNTIEANARFFESDDEVPGYALTMGLQTMMNAKSIVLLASGEKKKDALFRMIEGEVTEDLPASILQKHSDVTVITDTEI
ncbi:glucosamine-6-phosphate deaminase [Corticicoccus populi]|uniref:Glucosamine-6-phosphate deaminase n=1 Tax=Corticicoccus populi TaxID=1812821 RepID=A0ABW5WXA9_9STAP